MRLCYTTNIPDIKGDDFILKFHKKYLITHLKQAKGGEVIHTNLGNIHVEADEYIATNYLGEQFLVTKSYLEKNFVKVLHT